MTMTASATDARVARLRSILDERELDGMLISRIANKRYFSGLRLMAEEESTWPGTLLVTRDAKLLLADSRYTEQAEREAPGWEVILTTGGIGQDLPPILERLEVVTLGMEARGADPRRLVRAGRGRARRRAPRDGRRDRPAAADQDR